MRLHLGGGEGFDNVRHFGSNYLDSHSAFLLLFRLDQFSAMASSLEPSSSELQDIASVSDAIKWAGMSPSTGVSFMVLLGQPPSLRVLVSIPIDLFKVMIKVLSTPLALSSPPAWICFRNPYVRSAPVHRPRLGFTC